MRDDEVERIARTHVAIEVHILTERLEIGLHGAGGCPRGARRAVEAAADGAADPQRRLVHANHFLGQGKIAAIVETSDTELEIEARPEIHRLQRSWCAGSGAAAQRDVERRAGFELVERDRRSDHIGDALAVIAPRPGSAQHPFEAVAFRQSDDHFQRRTFGRGCQRRNEGSGPHAPTAVRSERQRHDHLRAIFVAHGIVEMRRGGSLERREVRPERERNRTQAEKGPETAQPALAADIAAEVGRQIESGEMARKLVTHYAPGEARDFGGIDDLVVRERGRANAGVYVSGMICVRGGPVHVACPFCPVARRLRVRARPCAALCPFFLPKQSKEGLNLRLCESPLRRSESRDPEMVARMRTGCHLGAVQGSAIKAVLGPTNTGKTHLAIERMAAHSSGCMGFPLRLLAREVYDRVRAIKGDDAVALITGEERIEPKGARYMCCTAEAMPRDGAGAAFVALDEAQIGADRERGHIFTDRLLNTRGREETMLLGAATLEPLVRQLVPEAEISDRPRFSTLTHIGPRKLSRLPPRSAIVAFSAEQVYAVAEMLRRFRGGAAVVMGALSPETRNKQVALFQNGEVDYIVATDAIGMGLNLDVNHVAFAGLTKFDGVRMRRLLPAEMAQIAGRAGRHQRDGTFGTLSGMNKHGSAPEFTEEEVYAIEEHRFAPLTHLY